ncbi:Uncharacterised protein [Chryseobacterium taklimakanense]|uniref:HNH endonuclease 5 domain-containing protein n=1 Tax=Chryseobacterium taklimakanense TaxID=536441 RepID=A0A239WRZ6_9FLAO|nr:hypothetical protein [Chryseobacterium taklimakanense]SNV36966.1 Uncharacterised protein [Chryseobacterium taklimakanense]
MDRLKEIDENYIVKNLYHLDEPNKIFLGNKEERLCRFCGKNSNETTFKKTAHAIPEFVENYKLFSFYECDTCNENFSKNLENHMSNFMNLHHSLSQVKGKRGIPSYKIGNNKSRLDWNNEGLSIMQYEEDNFNIIEQDEENKTIKIQGKRATYIPIAVYKCLTKMALSIMDEDEIVNFQNTINWINEADHSKSSYQIGNLKAIFTFITSRKSTHTVCFLLKRRKNNKNKVPYMMFFLSYSNFNFQIHIPMCELDKHLFNETVMIYGIPNVFEFDDEEFDGQTRTVLDLSSTEKVKDEIVEIYLSYESSKLSEN